MMTLAGRFLVPGAASGPVLATAPLSFWGGVDPATGIVIDRSHPALGVSLAGTVLVMPAGRGSSSSSTVFAEAIRLGTAPAAIVLSEADPILVVGALVADRLYGRACPVVLLAPGDLVAVGAAAFARIVRGEGDTARIVLATAV